MSQKEKNVVAETFDLAIIGGGLAGVLSASRLKAIKPDLNIILIEKDERPGGRLKSSELETSTWNTGLSSISFNLFEFWQQTTRAHPDAGDFPDIEISRMETLGFLQGSNLATVNLSDFMTAKGAKALGGAASSRTWNDINPILKYLNTSSSQPSIDISSEEHQTELTQSFANAWSETKKHPSAVVLEYFASLLGIPNLWTAPLKALVERTLFLTQKPFLGAWDRSLLKHLSFLESKGNFSFKPNCPVIKSNYDDASHWTLETKDGTFSATSLIVALPPWQAVDFIPRKLWPTSLLNIATKTKPVSSVVLSENIISSGATKLPDITLIPAEKAHVYISSAKEPNGSIKSDIVFQSTIDYEISLHALEATKAVKAVRRARKKFLTAFPDIKTEGDHIALYSVGWASSPHHADLRYLEKLEHFEEEKLNSGTLSFSGDAYGASYNGDDNLIKSVINATEKVSAFFTKE